MTFTWVHCPGGCKRRLSCPTDAIMQRIEENTERGVLPEFFIPYDKCTHEGTPCEWFVRKLSEFSKAKEQTMAKKKEKVCEKCGEPLGPDGEEFVERGVCRRCADTLKLEPELDEPELPELERHGGGGVVVTVSAYALGKQLGLEAGMAELERQIQSPDRESIQAARCIARLRTLADVTVRADTGGTVLGKVRSRHADAAWKLNADVWVSVDDDVEATTRTLRDLLEAVQGSTPRIVVVPCVIRAAQDGAPAVVNVDLPRVITRERMLTTGAILRPITRGGFGLVAMNRAALAAVRADSTHLAYVDQDGEERLGLFHSEIRDGEWLSEDLAFFARVPAHVEVEALLGGHTSHAGQSLSLAEVDP